MEVIIFHQPLTSTYQVQLKYEQQNNSTQVHYDIYILPDYKICKDNRKDRNYYVRKFCAQEHIAIEN